MDIWAICIGLFGASVISLALSFFMRKAYIEGKKVNENLDLAFFAFCLMLSPIFLLIGLWTILREDLAKRKRAGRPTYDTKKDG